MKIAIMTQPLGKNYGGIMQAWALQQVLKRMGHEVVTIDRQPDQPNMAYKAARLAYRVGMKAIGKRKAPINFEKHLPTILQHTRSFIDQHITMSEPLYSTQQLRDHFDRENYDAVIVGSDQTWRPKYSPNIYNFFLDFLEDKEILRIAYASSFGVDEWEYTEKQTKRCAELAKKFDAISVREDSAIGLCKKHLGVEAVHVLDPTLLLEKEIYQSLLNFHSTSLGSEGIYSYILDRSSEKKALLNNYAKAFDTKVFNSQPEKDFYHWSSNDTSKYVMPSPKDWIEGFYKGEYVVTDSFHGTVFSLVFQKPFTALGNMARGVSRFHSVLNKLDLLDRLALSIIEAEELEKEAPIEWNLIAKKLQESQFKSLSFIDKAL